MINAFLFVLFIFMFFMIMKSDIKKLICILFVRLSSINLENFKDRALIIPEILELIELHTYKFGLVYNKKKIQIFLLNMYFISLVMCIFVCIFSTSLDEIQEISLKDKCRRFVFFSTIVFEK